MQTKRLQVDLSVEEDVLVQRLMAHCGIQSKREFLVNMLTLFRWAANELAAGREVGSFLVQPSGAHLVQLDMPCFEPFRKIAAELAKQRPSAEELQRRAREPGVSAAEAMAALRLPLDKEVPPPV